MDIDDVLRFTSLDELSIILKEKRVTQRTLVEVHDSLFSQIELMKYMLFNYNKGRSALRQYLGDKSDAKSSYPAVDGPEIHPLHYVPAGYTHHHQHGPPAYNPHVQLGPPGDNPVPFMRRIT